MSSESITISSRFLSPSPSGRPSLISSSVPAVAPLGGSPVPCSALGSSPPSSLSGAAFLSSKPSAPAEAKQHTPPGCATAKRFLRRIQHDPTLDPAEFTVGFVESVQQQVRQSGAGAWSLRVHDQVHDIPYKTFLKKFPDENIPFHRIIYFKLNQSVVWESDYFRKKNADGDAVGGSISTAAGPKRSSSSGFSDPRLSIPGTSPPKQLFFDRPTLLGDQRGGSSDDDETERLSYDEWDLDDMVAGQMDGDGLPEQQELQELQLPEECWVAVLHSLAVRDICMMGRVNRWLRDLGNDPALWHQQYTSIFGVEPQESVNAATVRRMCRRSEICAARWLEADVQEQLVGYPDTACLQLDDSHVVSGDGQAVRVWSHVSGRRIATLRGHAGSVSCVAFDDNLVVSGCSAGAVRIWGMDDLQCSRTFRTAHEGGVAGVALLNGIPVSSGADGVVRLWDVASAQPIMALDAPRGAPVRGLEVQQRSGYIVTCGDGVQLWDAGTVQLLHDLRLQDVEDALGGVRGAADPGPGAVPAAATAEPLGGGSGVDAAAGQFGCVAYSGNVLAAGLCGRVVIFDPRCKAAVGSVVAPWGGGVGTCSAVALDEWKLVAAFNRGSAEGMVALYDMRAVPACCRGSTLPAARCQPLQVLPAPGRTLAMKFHGQTLVAGLSGMECCLWAFKAPGTQAPTSSAPRGSFGEHGSGAALASSGGVGSSSWGGELLGRSPPGPGGAGELGGSPPAGNDDMRRRRGKPAKMVKKQNRYPKRSK